MKPLCRFAHFLPFWTVVSPKTSTATILKISLPQAISVCSNVWEDADSLWNRYFENCGHACFWWHLIFLLTSAFGRPQPTLGYQSTFSSKRRLFPKLSFDLYDPTQYLSLFLRNGQESKKIRFSLISMSVHKKKSFWLVYVQFWWHRPSTYDIASLNSYNPN